MHDDASGFRNPNFRRRRKTRAKLSASRRETLFVSRAGQAGVMHANAIRTLLHGMGYEHITRHGFRYSFRDWADECTHYPRGVCEMALAHDERNQTEGAYSRPDVLDKRRALMTNWTNFYD